MSHTKSNIKKLILRLQCFKKHLAVPSALLCRGLPNKLFSEALKDVPYKW